MGSVFCKRDRGFSVGNLRPSQKRASPESISDNVSQASDAICSQPTRNSFALLVLAASSMSYVPAEIQLSA